MYEKLKKSKLFISGASLCLVLVVVGILGYSITIDKSPNANQIVPEWSNLGPGSTVYFRNEIQVTHESNDPAIVESEPVNAENFTTTPPYLYWALGNPNLPKIHALENTKKQNIRNQTPGSTDTSIQSRTFWLGSDQFGRDILSRMIIGARISLSIGFLAMLISLIIGIAVGIIAGYFGGKTDAFLSWLITVFWSVPTLLIALGLSMVLGKGYYQVLLATALSTWVEVARVVRGQTLQIKQREFVLAAKITGFSHTRIMLKHILPNLKGSLTVLATTNFASAILLEAGLGFLGLGVAPPTPSWGLMVKENLGYLVLDNSYLALIPGIAIMILVMAFNLMSMGLRDALDPYKE